MLNDVWFRDRIKMLFWEPGGYWLCTRRLEQGTFRWPKRDEPSARYSREELTLLLGGIDLAQTRKRKWYRRETVVLSSAYTEELAAPGE